MITWLHLLEHHVPYHEGCSGLRRWYNLIVLSQSKISVSLQVTRIDVGIYIEYHAHDVERTIIYLGCGLQIHEHGIHAFLASSQSLHQ